MKSDNCYVVISLDNYSIDVVTTLTQVADIINCNRNTLKAINERTVRNNYLIEPTAIQRVKRRR